MAGPSLTPVPWRLSYVCEKKLDVAAPRFHLGDPTSAGGSAQSGPAAPAVVVARFRFLRALTAFSGSRSEDESWPASLDTAGGAESRGGGRRWTEASCRFVATIAILVALSASLIRRSFTSAADPDFVAHSAWRASGVGVAAELACGDAPAAAGGDAA